MPTTRQLELFIAVAEAGSMRGAADKLAISQPSISKQIKALERAVGGELILRTRGGRATLSPLGVELLEDARNSVEMHRRLFERGGHGPAIRPRIYLRGYLMDLIKRRLSEFEAAGLPRDTSFVVSDDPASAMVKAEAAPNAFAIFGSVRLPASSGLISHVLSEQSCSVYASPQVARGLAEGTLRVAEIVGLYPSRAFKLTPWLITMMRQAGLDSGKHEFGSQFIDLLADRVAEGEGLSVFMDMHVRPLVEQGRLVPVARCPDPLLQVLQANPAADSEMFARLGRALRAL